MAAGKCHSLETSESRKFSNKHVCAHVRWQKGSARLHPSHPRGRAGSKPRTGIGQAGPSRGGHGGVSPPAPAPVCPSTVALQPPTPGRPGVPQSPGTGPLWPRRRVPLTHVSRLWCALDPPDSGSHAPGLCTLCSLHPLAPGCHTPRTPRTWTPYLWDPTSPHCCDPITLGPHSPGNPDPYTLRTPTPIPQEPHIPVTPCSRNP